MYFPGRIILELFEYHSYAAYAPFTAASHSFAHFSCLWMMNGPPAENRAIHGSHIFDSPYRECTREQDSDDQSQPGFLVKHYIDEHNTDAACIFDLKHEVAPLKQHLAAGPRGGKRG